MSWVRFGSRCSNGGDLFAPGDSACSSAPAACPGSDVYVYEDAAGGYTCCGCLLRAKGGPTYETSEEMRTHLREHVARGHHVPLSLITEADHAQ